MHDLHQKLDTLEKNVKLLLRKLNEAVQHNELLTNENNKLKLTIENLDVDSGSGIIEESNSKSHSEISEDKYHKIKSDIATCITEIDACIELIEQ